MGKAVKFHGQWFWTVIIGNRIAWYGPYQTQAIAETKGPMETRITASAFLVKAHLKLSEGAKFRVSELCHGERAQGAV